MNIYKRIIVGVVLTVSVLVINARLDHDRTFTPPTPTTATYCWYEVNDDAPEKICGTAAQEHDAEQHPEITVPCHEEMPCFDCNTMGNRVCGTEQR